MENIRTALLSNEVINKLIGLKESFLNRESAKEWSESVIDAKNEFHHILERVDFKKGGNLNSTDLNQLFKLLRELSSNRSLNKSIYKANGIDVFNNKLRKLYYGEQPLPERIDDFIKLKNVREQTVSQFLVIFDWFKYPFSSHPMKQILDLDTIIEVEARKVVLQQYNIVDTSIFSNRTINYLTYTVIYKQIKSILNLDNYFQINLILMILWHPSFAEEGLKEEEVPYTSVSLEKDLENYLAKNPSVIEVGLKLIERGKEFDAKRAGRIDLLCKDKEGSYVVVELKKGKSGDVVIGQIQRYIGWVMKNFNTDKVRGIIIANEEDEKLNFAVIPVKSIIQVKYYQVKFQINDEFQENNKTR